GAASAWALALGLATAHAQHEARPGHEWGYTGEHGPKHWGELKPEYTSCLSGKTQSPIDIKGAGHGDLAPVQFDYHATPLHIIDNGHTVQVNYAPGSSITVGGVRYELTQFHFHKPSEERVAGKRYAMVAHLVHKNAQGELAVVAVLLQQGAQNPFIQALWS